MNPSTTAAWVTGFMIAVIIYWVGCKIVEGRRKWKRMRRVEDEHKTMADQQRGRR